MTVVRHLLRGISTAFREVSTSLRIVASVSVSLTLAAVVGAALHSGFLSYPKAVRDPERVYRVLVRRGGPVGRVMDQAPVMSYPDFERMELSSRRIAQLAGYTNVAVEVGDGSDVTTVPAAAVTENYFDLMTSASRVSYTSAYGDASVWVSFELARRFPKVRAARRIQMNGRDVPVRGVIPSGFAGADRVGVQLWLPLRFASELDLTPSIFSRDAGFLTVLARPNVGTSPASMRDQIQQLIDAEESRGAETPNERTQVSVRSIRDEQFDRGNSPRDVAVYGLVLLAVAMVAVGAGNALVVAMLRILRDHGKVATRVALGASGADVLIEQSIAMSARVAAGAVVAAVVSASILLATTKLGYIGADTLASWPVRHVFLFGVPTFALSLGIIPGLAAMRVNPELALRSSGIASLTSVAIGRSANTLLALQIALVVSLVCATVALLSSIQKAVKFDYGYDPHGLHVVTVKADGATPAAARARSRDIVRVIAALPGVQAVSLERVMHGRRTV